MKDMQGIEWSEEHHAPSKKMKKDGTWVAKKGGDPVARKLYEDFQAPPSPGNYRNNETCPFDMFGIHWTPGEILPVPDEFVNEKRFKHAIELGCLVRVE